jgi:hypothetical protein
MDLSVDIAPIPYAELAAAFERVTGHPARYIDADVDEYWKQGWAKRWADAPAGYNADPNDTSTMKNRDNFIGFWNIWKYRVIDRDYKLLDEIHPNRIRSAEEWFRMEDKKGRSQGKGSLWESVQLKNLKPILKISEDGRKGKL